MAYCTLLGNLLRFLFTQICIVLVTLINLVSLPLLTPVLVPVLIYRYVLNKIGPILRPQLGAMVTSRGAIFSGDALFERKRPKVNIVIQCRLNGRLDIDQANKIAEERILSARRDDGSLMYPELRQFPTTLGGFYFWEWDPTFDIWNHVKHHRIELGPDYCGDEDEPLAKFHEQLLQAEWPERKPIWEIWVVDVDKGSSSPTRTTIFVKTHHSLTDGYSLLSLFSKFADVPYSSLENPIPAPVSRPLWKRVAFLTTFPLRTAYELSCVTVQRYSPFVSLPFLVPSKHQHQSPMRYICTKPISVDKVKAIKNHFRVTFTSVVNAALAGATRELMISKGGTTASHKARVRHVFFTHFLKNCTKKISNLT
ncbi:putative diacyglycerol O-acyltransferase MT1809 [Folsomia candida]|uniref:putative diacyglycerol O-acyltransferase MT1809 n=1 Tax=Folsomia candida TaxID=158441 RepID=UPI001604ED53|nr:putative diacyglycerol O-acyltransferase MT1809 [Folsomia candida]